MKENIEVKRKETRGRKKGDGAMKQVCGYYHKDLIANVEFMAKRLDTTRTELLRKAVVHYMAQFNKIIIEEQVKNEIKKAKEGQK